MKRLASVALLLFGAACATKEDTAALDSGVELPRYTWWQDVQPIVAEKCLLCHGSPALYGAPMSLVTYANTQARDPEARLIHERMAFRTNAPDNRMPPSSQPQLTAEQREIIRVWSLIGAPEGTPPPPPDTDAGTTDALAPGEDATTTTHPDATTTTADDAGTTTSDPDATTTTTDDAGTTTGDDAATPADDASTPDTGPNIRTVEIVAHDTNNANPYPLPQGNTSYICWAFDIPQSPAMATEEHAVRFEPIVDNAFFLHHMLLFRNTGSSAQTNPFDCDSWPLDWNLVAGWAPGRMADDIPPGAGVTVHPGDQFVLQAHYNGVHVPTEVDQSGIRVVLTDEPGLTSAGMVWSGPIFIQAINGSNVSKVSTCTIQSPITVFSVFPHMHQTGTRITLEVQRGGSGPWTNLVDINPWSFNDQPNVALPAAEQLLNNGDRVRTTCWWNTMGRSVSYGEASNDEMCFNFMYHYPLMSNQYACVDTVL